MAWVKGRLSEERYEAALAELDDEERRHAPPPEPTVVMQHVRELSIIDLEDRDPETGNLANRLLHGIIDRIEIREDRAAVVHLKAGLESWVRTGGETHPF